MSAALTRRRWLQGTAAGAFTVGFGSGAEPAAAWQPNSWLRLWPSGELELWQTKTDIGQGAPLAIAQIVCAELGADPARCRIELLPPGGARYVITGGSTSLIAAWRLGRPAAAAMRQALLEAAAARWGVPVTECEAQAHQVSHAASGRQLGFGELALGAARLPLAKTPPLRERLGGIVGASPSPAAWRELVRGRLTYGIDVRVPGQRFAVLARAPRLNARLLGFDEAAARAVPGVEAVLELRGTPWPSEHFMRDAVAVVARNSWAAQQGRAVLNARWEGGLAADSALLDRRMREALRTPAEQPGAAPHVLAFQQGEELALQRALAEAPRVIEAEYAHPAQAHAPLEPMNATARWLGDGRCEVWAPNHHQTALLNALMGFLKLGKEQLLLHTPAVGGSFGRRLDVDYAMEAALLARELQAPVQVLWTRDDDLRFGLYAPPTRHRLRLALDARGRPLALTHDLACVSVMRQREPAEVEKAGGIDRPALADALRFPVLLPLLRVRQRHLDEGLRVFWWRRGYSANHCFALECLLDEAALALGEDPFDYRLRLLADGARRQWTNGPDPIDAEHLDAVRMAGVLRRLRQMVGRRAGGLACASLGDTVLAQWVALHGRGKPLRVAEVITVVDCGLIVNPAGARAQVEGSVVFGLNAAYAHAISTRDGQVQQRGFADYPLLRIGEVPVQRIAFVESMAEPSGLGEPAAHPTAAALANALARAQGRRQRELPLRLS
ncbi:molybdopterin cofactor-binding domain-containing protein [Inhella sp.]|uniref:xanthine dehydrogenase family protein molybdopterin-binding subunit n=1 Tax=Inhella sp. TaxID=1921806 RepID=UPI0035AEE239